MDSFLARQPILNTERELYGYELLFRSGPENHFPEVDGDQASASVMSDCALVHGVERVIGDRRAFINVTRRVLVDELCSVMPAETTIFEILETIEPDDDVLRACRTLREMGYMLALDDVEADSRLDAFLPVVDYVKVDFVLTTPSDQHAIAQKALANNIGLVAEKIESHADFRRARDLGYSYFQGYFFCEPEMIRAAQIPSQKMTYLRLLQQINEPDVDLLRLEQIVSQDVNITYKLLSYLNSATFGFRSEIKSLRHAMAMLGLNAMKKWVSLMALSVIGDDKPLELIRVSLTRAKFSELLANDTGLNNRAFDLFLLGMFSVLDAMIDQPMETTLSKVAVSEAISETLMGRETELSPVYQLALALENGRWNELTELATRLGATEESVMSSYIDAMDWAGIACDMQEKGSKKMAS